jgi:acyl-homoserine-lactone acylase
MTQIDGAAARNLHGSEPKSPIRLVEFGDKVSARAISIGGESANPGSPHFGDQTERYAKGALRPIHFYPSDLVGHSERTYHPY